jgi:dihydrofolate synthase/folylpolyglutamate synthase
VITAAEQPEVLQVIEAVAQEHRAPLVRVIGAAAPLPQSALLGAHQKINAALARATVQVLQKQIPVSDAAAQRGLDAVHWPGRLQLLTRPSGQGFLLDGAHNVAGVEVLRAAWLQYFPTAPATLILGMLGDKDWQSMCQRLAPLATRILLVPVSSERTAVPQRLAEVCRTANPEAQTKACANLEAALQETTPDDFVVVAGSLYLIGAVLALLDPEFRDAGDERVLNEWGGTTKTTAARAAKSV